MFHLFLALPLLSPSAPQDAPPVPSPDEAIAVEESPTYPRAFAVLHHGDTALREVLVRTGEVWQDAGEFLVGAFAAPTIQALAVRGIETVEIGSAQLAEELWLISDRQLDELGGKLSPLCTEVLRAGGTRLLVLPAGRTPTAAGSGAQGSHVGMSRIVKKAWQPGAPFTWRGLTQPGSALTTAGPDPRIQALVDQVNQSNLSSSVASLSAIYTRRADRPEADTARDMIEAWFQSFGLTTRLENIGGGYAENVIAEITGTVYPNEIVVVGGHYDSLNGAGSGSRAPGADDNATGTAGVVEAARIFAGSGPYERTIRFIAFGAEEFGLIGSGVNAQASLNAGENIVAMLNTDMSAYRAAGDSRDCDFVTDNSSSSLIAFCDAAGAMYVSNWASKTGSLSGGTSDHQSYNSRGFPAVFYFEDSSQYSPYIHTSNDTMALSTNDFDLSEMIVKGLVAAAATKVEFVGLQVTHTPLDDTTNAWDPHPVSANVVSLSGSNVTSVDLSYSDDGVVFTTVPMSDVGGGNYAADIPSFGSPVTIHYYITAQDDQGDVETVPDGADLGGPAYTFFVGIKTVFYSTGFEAAGDEGWTHGQIATQDDWQRGTPQGLAGDPNSAYEGTKVWANDLGESGWNGEYASNTHNWLKSPAIDCSAATGVVLEFKRWLTVEESAYDQARILVDGVEVWKNPVSGNLIDNGWTSVSLDITAQAAGDASVVIEYRMKSDGGLEFGGWNIDDFALVQLDSSAGNMFVFGSGVNPAGSMSIISGTATIGDTAVLGVDNPLGTQGAGSLTFLFVSTAPDPNYPSGTIIPGYGMAGSGANGELLISIVSPDPSLSVTGGPWTGTPVPISVSIPNDPALIGFEAYGQGLILDPVAASGVRFGLTDGVVFQIGG